MEPISFVLGAVVGVVGLITVSSLCPRSDQERQVERIQDDVATYGAGILYRSSSGRVERIDPTTVEIRIRPEGE